MKKLIAAVTVVMLVLFTITADYKKEIDKRTIPEKVMDSVVAVGQSSGVIIHSEYNRALVLTAYHTIDDKVDKAACCGCDYDVSVYCFRNIAFATGKEKFEIIDTEFDVHNDLAIIEIKADRKLNSVKISKHDIKYGNRVLVGGNPQGLYRSLKQGIVSAPLRSIDGKLIMEIDANITFGSSGGGVFDEDGKLLGIIRSMSYIKTDYCYDVFNDEDEWQDEVCFDLPLSFIGFAVHQSIITKFLLNGKFKDDFSYLK